VNWLAHVYLSEPDVECRLGNLLADLVKGKARAAMSPLFRRGIACHQAIDSFTDYHPVVQRSKARISPEYGRFAGILVDIFYDHFLALHWEEYSPVSLDSFTAALYRDIRSHPIALPEEAGHAVERMIATDRLGSYRRLEGIEDTLRRVSERLAARVGRSFALEKAIAELTANHAELAADFAGFFPDLRAHVEGWCAAQTDLSAR
jgi:acyl carrier protein phosphodiesterase